MSFRTHLLSSSWRGHSIIPSSIVTAMVDHTMRILPSVAVYQYIFESGYRKSSSSSSKLDKTTATPDIVEHRLKKKQKNFLSSPYFFFCNSFFLPIKNPSSPRYPNAFNPLQSKVFLLSYILLTGWI